MELRIQHFRLVHAPPYCALSYAWGSSKRSNLVKITCEGQFIRVTRNCKDAIEQLSKTHESPSFLWVDAVCIDQACSSPSLLERDRQLKMMCSIYKNAQKTLVWLGEDVDDAGLCLDAIQKTFESGDLCVTVSSSYPSPGL